MTNTKTKVSGINMQSLPEVGISFDRTSPLSETNLDLGKLTFTLSEPAPVGGLSVNYNAVDSDGVPDDIDVSTINGTVLFDENGSPSGILIDEGATEARFEIIPKQDNVSEGEEFSIINLLPGDGYTIDPNNNTATFFLTDLPIVTFSVDRTVISEGGESQIFTFQLNEPAPDGGLTVKLQLEDPDGDFGDGGFPPQLFNNISDSNFAIENGKLIQEFTISPGATEASFGFVAGEDNKVEGDETYTLTLLDGEDYSIDAASKPIVSTITDAGENLSGINFDEHNLTAGTIITNQFDGVEFSSSSEFGVMLFDTNNVTGDDFDLANPDLENVLIISEDGDSNDPDDNAAGGIINLKFDYLVTVNSIGLLDIDEPGSSITFYDENSNPIETVKIPSLDDNSFQEIEFDVDNVASLDIDLAGSGAVTEIDFAATPASPYSNIYEDTLTGANITVLDVNSLLDDVIANPEEFGLTNVTEPFLAPLTLTPTAGANPDEYLFYDTVHPTVADYTLVRDLALETLAVEAEY